MKKTAQNPVIILFTISITIAVFALAFATVLAIRFSSDMQTQSDYISELQTENHRMRFCYDNQIIPCDDASITAWNAVHPEDAFHLGASDE